jgi:hypothetical protein
MTNDPTTLIPAKAGIQKYPWENSPPDLLRSYVELAVCHLKPTPLMKDIVMRSPFPFRVPRSEFRVQIYRSGRWAGNPTAR